MRRCRTEKRTQTNASEPRRRTAYYPLRVHEKSVFKQTLIAGNLAGRSIGLFANVLNDKMAFSLWSF